MIHFKSDFFCANITKCLLETIIISESIISTHCRIVRITQLTHVYFHSNNFLTNKIFLVTTFVSLVTETDFEQG